MILATLFTHPLDITGSVFWMMFPLSIMAVVIYKTVRITELHLLVKNIVVNASLVIACEIGLIILCWVYLNWLH